MNKVRFDKRLELIFGLQYYVVRKYGVNFPWICENYKEYNDKFYELCDKNISEELVEYILDGGLESYNRCVDLALHIDYNYNIVNRQTLDDQLLKNPNVDLDKAERLFKEFVEKSNYEGFFKSNEEYYNFIIEKFNGAVNYYESYDFNKIINFYGYKKGEANIIQVNFSDGSYGPTYNGDLYYINGVINTSKEKGKFHFSDGLIINLYHEFSHSYINPLGRKYFKDIDFNSLFLEAKEDGLESCYTDMLTLINEYCVRAVSIYLVKKAIGEQLYEKRIEWDKKRGYTYIKELCELLDNKDLYSTFEEFYKNEIVTFFINLEKELSVKNTKGNIIYLLFFIDILLYFCYCTQQ